MALAVKQAQSEAAHESVPSFEELFQAHWTQVVRVIFRLVGDRGEAEDLALEVFWRLHASPPPQQKNLAGWLYRVAVNLGYNALRGRKRRERYEWEAGVQAWQADHEPDPAAEVELREQRRQVQQALASLKPRSAQILTLRAAGLSYAEIAAALGLSPSSVGTLLARAEQEFEAVFGQSD